MKRFRKKRPNRRSPERTARLALESLEHREMLHASISPFDGAAYLTLSFAPDGTEIASQSNTLATSLSEIGGEREWKETILGAFQEWAQHTNADIGLVDDEGLPFGVPGLSVGDDRFGDIRIGAIQMDPQVAAASVTYDQPIAGTWAGDVLLNTNFEIQSLDELRSIILHEAGHVFGLTHSHDVDSVMHEHGGGGITQLSAHDIEEVIELRGERSPDIFEQRARDDRNRQRPDFSEVVPVEFGAEGLFGVVPNLIHGDITDADDVDTYSFEAPLFYSGSMTFRFRVAGISQLQASIAAYDPAGNLLASGTPAANGRLNITLPAVSKEKIYFRIKASDTAPSAMRVGGYSLVTSLDDWLISEDATIEATSDGRLRRLEHEDLENLFEFDGSLSLLFDFRDQDDSLSTADSLPTFSGFERGTHFSKLSSILDENDHDFYRFEMPRNGDNVVTVRLEPAEVGGLVPAARLYNGAGELLNTTTLANGSGILIVQSSDLRARGEYYVEVFSGSADPAHSTGNYHLSVTTGTAVTELDTVANLTLTPSTPQQQSSLYIARDQFVHFVAGNDSVDSTAVLRILDSQGVEVLQLAVGSGEMRSASTVHLGVGEYQVIVDGLFGNSESQNVSLMASVVSALLSVPPDDPTDDAVYVCAAATGAFCFPDGTETTDEFYLSGFGTSVSTSPIYKSPLEPETWWSPTFQAVGAGDVNADGTVDSDDLGQLLNNFGDKSGLPWDKGNLNSDATVDSTDLGILLNAFGESIVLTEPSATIAHAADPSVAILQYDPLDVNQDGAVSPIDALQILNWLNQAAVPISSGESINGYAPFDLNTDGHVSPIDALMVINQLNSHVADATDPLDVGYSFGGTEWLAEEESDDEKKHG